MFSLLSELEKSFDAHRPAMYNYFSGLTNDPLKDFTADDNETTLKLAVPELDKEDITVEVEGASIKVKNEAEDKITKPFDVSYKVDQTVYDLDNIEVDLNLGVLYIAIPKLPEKKTKTIKVNVV